MTVPYRFRYARLVAIRWPISIPALVALLGLATSYTARGVRSSASAQPVVAAFDDVVPVWPVVFWGAFIALLAALAARTLIALAYVVAAVAFWLYAAALLAGSITAGAAWPTASLAFAMAVQSFVLALTFAKGR